MSALLSASYALPATAGLPIFTTEHPELFEAEAKRRGFKLLLRDAQGYRHTIPKPLAKQIAPRPTPRAKSFAPAVGDIGSWVTWTSAGVTHVGQVWSLADRDRVFVVTDDQRSHRVWISFLSPYMHTSHTQEALL